jgi:hypothetical protein
MALQTAQARFRPKRPRVCHRQCRLSQPASVLLMTSRRCEIDCQVRTEALCAWGDGYAREDDTSCRDTSLGYGRFDLASAPLEIRQLKETIAWRRSVEN